MLRYFFLLFLALFLLGDPLFAQTDSAQTVPEIQEAVQPGFSIRDFNPTFAIGSNDFSQYTRPQDVFKNTSRTKSMPRAFENHIETKSLQKFITSNCESRVKPWMDDNFKPWLNGNNATGDWCDYRTKCIDKGFELGVSSVNEVWGNTTGGIKTGTVATGATQLATAIDFEKLMGWQGGSFYSRWVFLTGQDPSAKLVGNFFSVSNLYGYNTFRNIELWIQQKFLGEQFSIRAGQLSADTEFFISDYGALFLNNTFGWPSFLGGSIPYGGPNYPVGTPGIRFQWKPNEQVSFKVAAFQGNPESQNVNNHGFYWDLDPQQGFLYFAETDYRYDIGLPGQFKAGTWLDSATFPNANGSHSSFWGNYGIYGIVDQMIYRKPVSASKALEGSKNVLPSGDGKNVVDAPNDQGLGVFVRTAFQPEDRNLFGFYCDGGLNYKGLIPTREKDTFGLAVAYGELGSGAVSSEGVTQQNFYNSNGNFITLPPGALESDFEMAIEATYLAQLTPWFAIQPDVQYIIHPSASSSVGNALVLGLRATVIF